MYTNEQKMKAVELYIKYNHRATQVSRELGYPHPNFVSVKSTCIPKMPSQRLFTETANFYSLSSTFRGSIPG